ncbi:AbrB family transcriptional regulator [Rhodoferax sp.]|uniref:AbrB family transcriptional regulator n=1 Tax=Rhodoferax sp. TaxID=50421 RepID=UPI00260F06AD|nr:AbrB family transcriptional regulator [Rhodoferax sp.]MDD2918774.1 AbrB family transcriptional regulator [Rhodoferax sp.]
MSPVIPRRWRWLVLLLVSGLLGGALQALHFPAGVLLGCMVAAILMSVQWGEMDLPKPFFMLAQAVLGCLMAQSMRPPAFTKVLADWPLFLGINLLVIGAGGLLGWLLVRRKVLPGTTALWGIAPGAASAMVLMAESYGADMRLVAFMQYTRVVLVTAVAAGVAHLAMTVTAMPAVAAAPDPATDLQHLYHLGATLLLVMAAAAAAQRWHIPAGGMVLALVCGTVLQALGVLVIELPAALLVLAYAVIGWSVGLRFTRDILLHAWQVLPMVLAAIASLMGLGLVLALLLVMLAGVAPLTAYLATSPGGADSVVVIAATSAVDAGFVMAMQLVRFLMVLVLGPRVTAWLAKK